MRRLDQYVLGYFFSSFCVALFFLVGLYTMLDAVGKVDEFVMATRDLPEELRGSVPGYVARFYLLSAPYYYLQFAPFIALLAVLFTAVRMAQNNELVPIVTAGVSLFRLVTPLFFGAAVIAVSMVGIREYVIPRIDDLRDSLKDRLINQRIERKYSDVWLVAGRDNYLCKFFWPSSARVEELTVISRTGNQRIHITSGLAEYRNGSEGTGWYLENGRKSVREGEVFKAPEDIRFLKGFHFTPYDLFVAYKGKDNPTELSFGQLNRLSLWDPEKPEYMTLLHYFLTFPLMALILPLLGLPFVLRFEKRASTEGIGIAFLIFFAYFGVDFYLRGLGNHGTMHPLIASWLPVVLFGSLGIILFDATKT